MALNLYEKLWSLLNPNWGMLFFFFLFKEKNLCFDETKIIAVLTVIFRFTSNHWVERDRLISKLCKPKQYTLHFYGVPRSNLGRLMGNQNMLHTSS